MSASEAKLPPGVAESWFHVHAGGEVWVSRVCLGVDLPKVIEDILGDRDGEDREYLGDPNCWHQLGGKCRSIYFARGEDPDLEITMIDDPEFTALRARVAELEAAIECADAMLAEREKGGAK